MTVHIPEMAAGLSRRAILQSVVASTVLFAALDRTRAWARAKPSNLDRWARNLVDLNDGLARKAIGVTEWQDQVATLNRSVPVEEIVRYLDIDRITRAFRYPTLLAEFADPVLPLGVLPTGRRRQWFVRVFGMRRGGAIIPHVHNNMVSAHLVVSGAFHARTHDRVKDQADAVLLRPSLDLVIGAGDVITMSDQRDNQHWLVAQADRSMTFDVGVVDLPASWSYGHKANANHMVFVDADRTPERDGLVVAPVMTFQACAARYAA